MSRTSRRPRILVTGASGAVGRIACEDLPPEIGVVAVDVRAAPGNSIANVRLDVAREFDRLVNLVGDVDAVLHLAYIEEDRETHANFLMAKNVCEAVRARRPPPRLVLASSIHAVGGWLDWTRPPLVHVAARRYDGLSPEDLPILSVNHPLRPNGLYGALKGYTETLARWCSDLGVETVVVRFGAVRPDDSLPEEPGSHAFWLSRRDCAEIIRRAVTVPLREPWNVVFAVSANRWRVHDLDPARRILGFTPEDGHPG